MKYREALAKAKAFGVIEDAKRGKGSHRLWIIPDDPEAPTKGRRSPIACHGDGYELKTGTLKAALRRLGIDWEQFLRA